MTDLRATWHLSCVLALTGVMLSVTPASADIDGFTLGSVEPVGTTFELDDRFTRLNTDDEYVISIEDCEAYLGNKQVKFSVNLTGYDTSFVYGVAYSSPGQSCKTTAADFDDSKPPECTVVTRDDAWESKIEFNVGLDFLMGGSCDTNSRADSIVYIVLEDVDESTVETTDDLNNEQIVFDVDLQAPLTPTLDSLAPGDEKILVSWSDDNNDLDETEYIVYWSTTSIPSDADARAADPNVQESDEIDNDSASIERNITNGTEYFVRVAAIDQAGNIGPLSEQLSTVAQATNDFWEQYVAAGGTDKGGYCFIATAAWGSPMTGELDLLRGFRDNVLLTTGPGRTFVEGYYTWGRFAAIWIADKPALRAAARVALVPLVWLAWLTGQLGLWGALAALACLWMLAVALRRRDTLPLHLMPEARR